MSAAVPPFPLRTQTTVLLPFVFILMMEAEPVFEKHFFNPVMLNPRPHM